MTDRKSRGDEALIYRPREAETRATVKLLCGEGRGGGTGRRFFVTPDRSGTRDLRYLLSRPGYRGFIRRRPASMEFYGTSASPATVNDGTPGRIEIIFRLLRGGVSDFPVSPYLKLYVSRSSNIKRVHFHSRRGARSSIRPGFF